LFISQGDLNPELITGKELVKQERLTRRQKRIKKLPLLKKILINFSQ